MSSVRSRTPAIITIAIVKPTAVPRPLTNDSIKLYEFCTFVKAIPSTAQLVVISGRYTPSASYKGGIHFLSTIQQTELMLLLQE